MVATVSRRRVPYEASRRARAIRPFEVMDVLSRARAAELAGHQVIHLEIGEPDFATPEPVVRAARAALKAGLTGYTQTLGLPELRESLACHYQSQLGAKVAAARVAITTGASGALSLALGLLVDPGDEVVVPDPGYPSYRHFVRLYEGRARAMPLAARTGFQPTLEALQRVWTPRTVGLIVGSPSNPTGSLIPYPELRRIAAFIADRGGWLLVDEIYQGISFEEPARTAAALPGTIVVINSFSKYFCMTGWRIGWAVLPLRLVRHLEKLSQHLTICPPALAQYAALAALQPATIAILEGRRREFARRRDFLVPALEQAGLRVPARPGGAFYAYADCSGVAPDSRRFAFGLLEREHVAVTPGFDFGSRNASRYVRFAFTRPAGELEEAACRIRRYCERPD